MNAAPTTLSTVVADWLADPETALPVAAGDRQHLAYGLPGIALLHIERAAAELAPWERAHAWLTAAVRQPVTSGPDSHPFYGAPAVAHALACAADHLPGSYSRALGMLDEQLGKDVHRRLSAAHRRIDAGRFPDFAEFDTIRGLAGYGAYLLRRQADSGLLRAVLEYCVRLTMPLTDPTGEVLPGWWAPTGPTGRPDGRFPDGHGNSGMSHGVGGVLALLALSARRGTVVDGHQEAMRAILAWLDRWQEHTRSGLAWPYWVTREELRAGRLASHMPRRPSWCYGTAGLARAQQLAALALGDVRRQVEAEQALAAALTDTGQLTATRDNGLCHGFAGLAHIAARTAADAHPTTAARLHATLPALLDAVCPLGADLPAVTAVAQLPGPGFLDGGAGIALAVLAPATGEPPRTAWDACLLTV